MRLWSIGVSGWVLQDAHRDFGRGERTHFAVEFAPTDLSRAAESRPFATSPDGDDRYEISGAVVFASDETLMINCGILVYTQISGSPIREGGLAAVAGRGSLLFESPGEWPWSRDAERMPPARYAWMIERIRRESGAYVEVAPNTFSRDLSRRSFEEIEATDVFGRDLEIEPHGPDYLLDCLLLDERPRPLVSPDVPLEP